MENAFIVGNDLSEYQGQIDWSTYKNNTNFVWMRSSYGVNSFDHWFGYNRQQARDVNLPRGFYHYAYPQLNTPEEEANWFTKVCYDIEPGELLALDFEEHNDDPVGWCKMFLDTVSNKLGGYKPLIYLNLSQVDNYDWKPVIDTGYGLWLADWTFDPTSTNFHTPWSIVAFRQWTDKQQVPGIQGLVDGNVFYGDKTALLKYGYKPEAVVQTSIPIPTQPTTVVVTTTTTSGNTSFTIPMDSTNSTIGQKLPIDDLKIPSSKSWLQKIIDFLETKLW